MNKNIIWAVVLALVFYTFWFRYMEKKYPNYYKQNKQSDVAEVSKKTAEINQPANAPKAVPVLTEKAEPAAKNVRRVNVDSSSVRSFTVETPSAQITYSAMGAGISSFVCKTPVTTAQLVIKPDPGFFSTFGDVEFDAKKISADAAEFSADLTKNVSIAKSYNWTEGGLGTLKISVENRNKYPVDLGKWGIKIGPGIGTIASQQGDNASVWKSVFVAEEAGRKKPVLNNLRKEANTGQWLWAGLQNRYFLAALVPVKWDSTALKFFYGEYDAPKGFFAKLGFGGGNGKDKAPGIEIQQENAIVKQGETKEWEFLFYLGPKDYDKLIGLGHGLDRSVEFGFFSQFGKWILKFLEFNHKITGNYGWSIIILSLAMQFLMYPLTLKSMKSSLMMKKIQPELKAVQIKYKDDKQKLQQETLALYKKHNFNPFSGCLPILVQMPVFFALFTALRNAWSLHGAKWILWITDLSAKDPYFVLPILMGAVMYFQQKSSSSSAGMDPAQEAMMKWMPIIMTFMFLSFPSGLVLYWLVGSIFSYTQQTIMRKKLAQ